MHRECVVENNWQYYRRTADERSHNMLFRQLFVPFLRLAQLFLTIETCFF